MQQLPNVKDETCKNQDCAALVSKRRHREAENKRVREEERKAGRRGKRQAEKTGDGREKPKQTLF